MLILYEDICNIPLNSYNLTVGVRSILDSCVRLDSFAIFPGFHSDKSFAIDYSKEPDLTFGNEVDEVGVFLGLPGLQNFIHNRISSINMTRYILLTLQGNIDKLFNSVDLCFLIINGVLE